MVKIDKRLQGVLIGIVALIGIYFMAKYFGLLAVYNIPGNEIVNGTFETRDFTGWNIGGNYGDPAIQSTGGMVEYPENSGTWGCRLSSTRQADGNYKDAWIQQDTNIEITEEHVFSFYAGVYYQQKILITIQYSNNAFEYWEILPSFKTNTIVGLDVGKTVVSVKFERIGFTPAHTELDSIFIGIPGAEVPETEPANVTIFLEETTEEEIEPLITPVGDAEPTPAFELITTIIVLSLVSKHCIRCKRKEEVK